MVHIRSALSAAVFVLAFGAAPVLLAWAIATDQTSHNLAIRFALAAASAAGMQ